MFLLASMICSNSVIPVFADEVKDGSDDPVIYQVITDKSESKKAVTDVKASIKSSYEITLPKTMAVNNGDNAYNVNVKGDIGGTEQISVVPDATISLYSVNKDAVTGNITQDKQTWNYTDVSKKTNDVLTGTDVAGNINISGLTAGHWTGTFNFNISSETYGEDVMLTADNLSTYGIENKGDIVIPAYVTDEQGIKHKVIEIGNDTFRDCTNLTKVKIEKGIKVINKSAFEGCTKLENIIIPDTIEKIEQFAFHNTPWLNSKKEENNFVIINGILIKNGNDIPENIVIPETVNNMTAFCLQNCKDIKHITIPNTVTQIGKGAFYGCDNLIEITIPDNIKSIEDYTFQICTNLNKITLSEKIKTIGEYAFSDCENLTEINMPNNITQIGNHAFSNCENLTSISIPNDIETIENYAWVKCSKLSQIEYKGKVYTSKKEIINELKKNNVNIGMNIFFQTNLNE